MYFLKEKMVSSRCFTSFSIFFRLKIINFSKGLSNGNEKLNEFLNLKWKREKRKKKYIVSVYIQKKTIKFQSKRKPKKKKRKNHENIKKLVQKDQKKARNTF